MTLEKLIELHNNGALAVKEDDGVVSVAGMELSDEQINTFAENLGWEKYAVSAVEAVQKISKFISPFKGAGIDLDIAKETEVTFQNFKANTYGKTYDRILLTRPRYFKLTIIHGMENIGGAYVIYETSGSSIPLAKCKNIKQVVAFINAYD